jgi:hypothetical protein
LKHGALAKLETAVELAEDRVIRFQHYEATAGMLMKGCCDNLDNCPFQTDLEVNAVDHNWSKSSFQCPASTKKVRTLTFGSVTPNFSIPTKLPTQFKVYGMVNERVSIRKVDYGI